MLLGGLLVMGSLGEVEANNNNGEFIQEEYIGFNTQFFDENGNWLEDGYTAAVVRVRQGARFDESCTVFRATVTDDKIRTRLFLNTGNDNQNKPIGNYSFTYKGTEYTADYDTTGMNPTQMQGVGGWCYEMDYEFDRRDSDNGGGSSIDNGGGSSSSDHHHHKCEDGHKYSCYVCKEPTTEEDGLATWRCERCGIIDPDHADELNEEGFIIISAYPVFNDKLESDIKGAEAGSTVSISTKRWISVRRAVLEDLAANPSVTLSVKFVYNNEEHTMTIKGDDPKLAEILARQDSFYGLKFLHDYVNAQ